MGCNMRDKSLRGSHRKARHSAKNRHQSTTVSCSKASVVESNPKPSSDTIDFSATSVNNFFVDGQNESSVPEVGVSGHCTEEQLGLILGKNIDLFYKDAFSRLSAMGYDDDVAFNAVLHNGHCYGTVDVLTNIIQNAVAYINSITSFDFDDSDDDGSSSGTGAAARSSSFAFSELRHLQDYSVTSMICLLQEVRPDLDRSNAMWCLLMADLNVSLARSVDVPGIGTSRPSVSNPSSALSVSSGGVSGDVTCAIPCSTCKFHRDGSGEESECSRKFNISNSIRTCLKRNAAMSVAGVRADPKLPLSATQAPQDMPGSSSPSEHQDMQKHQNVVDVVGKEYDVVDSVLRGLENMSLEEEKTEDGTEDGTEDAKKEMILGLIHQIRELEEQLKERKEWAQQKAIQAAQKLSKDLIELKTLRMEIEENQQLKKGKKTLEESTMKRLSEMENALRKASGQVDRANANVKKKEAENAEIKAEMEASKLSAAESANACLEVTKREKKCLKRLLAWEKQKKKLQQEIADEQQKCLQLHQTLDELKEAQKEAEEKWRLEVKAKEEAIMQVEEERKAKEAAELSIKRRHEALRQKFEIDFQRLKDDIQRLDQEICRLTSFAEKEPTHLTSNVASFGRDRSKIPSHKQEATGKNSLGSHTPQESSQKQTNRAWKCFMCMEDEVSVVFLPCAHQVFCVNCNEDHEKRAKACPCCYTRIKERIRVYGASS